jgi:type IV pilus assembly protein PilA
MFCPGCGNDVATGERFCRVCGKEVSAPVPVASAMGAPPETSGKAIASFILGLFLFAFPMSILAVIFGHLSLSDIRKSAGRLKGEGLAIAGLVMGYLGVAAIPVILIIAAIAIPNLLRARMAANESSAVRAVRQMVTAEVTYSTNHPQTGYTCNFSELAGEGLIDGNLASGQQRGYSFELLGCSAAAEGQANSQFRVVAYPVTKNTTGTRAFCSDESGVIKMDGKGSPQDCMSGGSTL